MGFMNRMGEGVAKKPLIPFLVLIVVTAASLGMIAMNPPSFDMDEESFRPDNDIMRAQTLISESFTSTASVISMADTRGTGGDIFTQSAFLDVLEYERTLYEMEYTDINGDTYRYSDLPGFMILSPVSQIASLIASSSDYDVMILVIGSLTPAPVADATIKGTASAFFADPDAAALAALLTNDKDMVNMTASGCMISVMMVDSALDIIKNGEEGFEQDILNAAKNYTTDNPGSTGIKAVGMRSMMNEIGTMAQEDISKLLPIALAVIVILLLIIYRDVSDTLVALLGLVIAIIWTFGIAAFAGIGMSTIAIAVPILILALGIDYSLHLVFRYREERGSGNEPKKAIGITMGSVGQALVLATVTTAIAFLSYQTSELAALADFGLMCAIGIVCAFASMMLLIPTTQILRDRRAAKKGKDPDAAKRFKKPENEKKDILGRISGVGGKMAAKNPWAVLGAMVFVVALCGYSATNLSYDFNMYDFIPEETEAHNVITYLNDNYSTTTSTTSVLIYSEPWSIDTIRAMEDSLNNMADPKIRGLLYYDDGPPDAEHIGTALKDLGEKLTGIDPGLGAMYGSYYYAVFDPVTGKTLPGATQAGVDALKNFIYVVLPTVDPALPRLVNATLSSVVPAHGEELTRMILHMTPDIETDNNAIIAMSNAVDKACAPLASVGFVTTGNYIAMAVTMEEMNKSQMTSLFFTIVLVILILTAVMYYTHRSFLLGAMATVPTLISVIMVWGTMAAINMPLNVMTLTIASLAVGLGVTYGIHISNRYATEIKKNGLAANDAIKKTMRETGKGVFAAALTTVAGFGVMGFSKILPMYQFGIITALAIGFGYIGSIFVLPSLLVIWGRYAERNASGTGGEKQPKRTHPEWDRFSMVPPSAPKARSRRSYLGRATSPRRGRRPKI